MTVFAVEYLYDSSTAARRDEVRADHRGWLAGIAENGQLLASGPYEDGTGALLLFKADDAEALHALLAQDPFAVEGLLASSSAIAWNPVSGPLASQF
ncbi:YciI family protein [Sinomonas sp. JGH33]|uniref:YciI family protein n=1 Tax=Sinomonas terricola TaxID=3110330 RepID=A0ABU5T542_9MICC|nr:YciI family protein [Sinomonas sp. JGH33]MEA5454601.1 YciI family protein [Sinomonas sp. JGH33]